MTFFQKISFIGFSILWYFVPVFGFYVQPETGTNAVFRINESDTLFFFDGRPELKTSDGSKVDWYILPDTTHPIVTNTSECYIYESGDGVFAKNETGYSICFVFDYQLLQCSIEVAYVTFYCKSTDIDIPSNIANFIPSITYVDIQGRQRTYERNIKLTYNDIKWNETFWDKDSITGSIPMTYGVHSVDAMYLQEPEILLQYDDIGEDLYGRYNNVSNIIYNNQPIAVTSHPMTTTSVRTALNEKERPKESTQISGSAPLDILFQSFPSPNVDYVRWRIYHGSTFIVQRSVEDQRYEFTEEGNYRVICYVSNSHCPCEPDDDGCLPDSTAFDISVGTSILRVPNVFTPNGDGVNDEFRVYYRSIRDYHIQVYNRWGKLVYSSHDPSKGWDGRINGIPAAVGAYYYVIRAIGFDAPDNAHFRSKSDYKKAQKNNSSSVVGVYQLSGDINLLR